HRRVTQEFEVVADSLFVLGAVGRTFAFANTRCFRVSSGFLLATGYQVPLIHNDDDRSAALMGIAGDGGIERAYALGCVNHQQRDVSRFEMLSRHHDGEFLRHEMGFALAPDSGRVNEAETFAVDLDDFIDGVTSRARDWRHN